MVAVSACTREPQTAAEAPLPEVASPYDVLPEGLRGAVLKPFMGDLDEMIKRRVIRVAVTFNRTHYFIDKGQQRGLAYESITQFENDLNADLKTGNLKVHVAAVPLSRDQLASALLTGKVDLVAAMLTVTPERRALAAFSLSDTDQRERSRGHRSRCAADRDAGRPGRPGGVRPRREYLCREPRQTERTTEGARQAGGGDHAGSRRSRGRRRARDGQRRSRADHHLGRLSRRSSGRRCSPT